MKRKTVRKYYNFLKFKRDFTLFSVKKAKFHEILLFWLKSVLNRNQFLILSGILVGCTAGLAGVLLKSLVFYIHDFITHKVHFEQQIVYYAVFPFLGIVLTTWVVIFFFQGQDRKGIPGILYEIARNSSIVSSVKMYSQVVQSALTVGLGGSAGLESPIAVTGSAIGSNYAQTYHLDYRERTLLLAAGATAGIASAFNAPIAGMMFAFEILLTGVVFTDFIPLVVAAVCGNIVSRLLLNEDVLFHFHSRLPFNYHNLPYYLILGLLCGLYARYFVLISKYVEDVFKGLKYSKIQKSMIGGGILSVLCVLYPPLFGEGYDTVKALTDGQVMAIMENSFFGIIGYREWVVVIFLTIICLLKAFASSITIQSGGNGGNFAPSLFSGGTLGFVFATFCTQIGITDVPVVNLVLVGMAGVMSGVFYAPLTAIFLIAESSSGYDLFIPLMIVSVMSFLMAKWFSPISPDLQELAKAGKIFTKEHDKNLLSLLHTLDLIDRDVQTIQIDASFDTLSELIKMGKRNRIAVLDERNFLVGIITLDALRPLLFDRANCERLGIAGLMQKPSEWVHEFDDIVSIMRKFDESGLWNLPIVNSAGIYMGFISKNNILNSYRQLLKVYS